MKNSFLMGFVILLSIFHKVIFPFGSAQEIFTRIYTNREWGVNQQGQAWSGCGSAYETTSVYREFLSNFLRTNDIKSVVDIGCGDWEFSQYINWDGIDYKGFDVVSNVIEKNRLRFEKDTIHFYHGDISQQELPAADLLICKDVFQHLPIYDIFQIIKQCAKYKYCLITNDVYPHSLTSDNPEIVRGDYRPVDLTKPPFNLKGIKVLTFNPYNFLFKQTILIINT